MSPALRRGAAHHHARARAAVTALSARVRHRGERAPSVLRRHDQGQATAPAARVLHTIRPCLAPLYLLGVLERIAVVFAPADVEALLALLSLVLADPTIITMSLALRYEYIKVLAQTFEFGFLLVIGTMWIMSFTVYTHDLRGVIMPILWCDFVSLLLVETYFEDQAVIYIWFAIPVLVLSSVKTLVFIVDIFVRDGSPIHNRLLLHHMIGPCEPRLYVLPFLISRQVALLTWYIRILHHIRTRKSDNDLIMLLGNVEYDSQFPRRPRKSARRRSSMIIPIRW